MRRRQANLASPLKKSATTPNLRAKSAQLLSDGLEEGEDVGEDDEDEETLQLKLAAIEARLKLKQLQKNRGKAGTPNPDRHEAADALCRPASAVSFSSHSQDPPSRLKSTRVAHHRNQSDSIQVPLSPTRRLGPPMEPTSPGRYRLGIDKGLKGSDVSLRRPPSSRGSGARPTSRLGSRDGTSTRSGNMLVSQPHSFEERRGKSFSERMAEGRAVEKSRRELGARSERIQANRSSAFQYDKAEMETFKAAAAAARSNSPSKPQNRSGRADSFGRDDIVRSANNLQMSLKRSQTTPSMRRTNGDESKPFLHRRSQKSESELFSSQPRSSRQNSFTDEPSDENERVVEKTPDSSKFEPFSSLHLSNRILPHSFLSRNLEDKKVLRIPDLLRMIKGPSFELPDNLEGDYVVFGIVASKSDPKHVKESKAVTAKETDPFDDGLNNRSQYMVITLTDLKWTIDLFLFDTAFPRYYRLSEGILVAILNPTILPPPKHKLDTNKFGLSISSSDDKVLEVGFSRDIGFCKAVRKDGKTCESWVDGRKTEFCDFHVDLQVRRTQAGRMGINNGTGMLGPGGRSGSRTGFSGGGKAASHREGEGLRRPDGAQYDADSQSLYYVAPSVRPRSNLAGLSFQNIHSSQSAASLIDADNDDPFIAVGMMARGKENKAERFRRRLVEQQRERDITQKLRFSRGGGIAADYLRARNNENIPAVNIDSNRPRTQYSSENPIDANFPSSSVNNPALGMSFKRAEAVRLSPKKRAHDGDRPHGSGVKKTRFITSKGIKEAGRDSLGGNPDAVQTNDNDDDDDLEIV
ncbi:Mcm10/DnaG-type zinc finger protein [Aspergillus lucknowensis]|uniref:Zinc finger Mcm10/DnaG-type domain-containing protein n=1 Tax=Aspergillus lucknowensis TaxID=176173 RepID=A0ABR4LUT4_9EURO